MLETSSSPETTPIGSVGDSLALSKSSFSPEYRRNQIQSCVGQVRAMLAEASGEDNNFQRGIYGIARDLAAVLSERGVAEGLSFSELAYAAKVIGTSTRINLDRAFERIAQSVRTSLEASQGDPNSLGRLLLVFAKTHFIDKRLFHASRQAVDLWEQQSIIAPDDKARIGWALTVLDPSSTLPTCLEPKEVAQFPIVHQRNRLRLFQTHLHLCLLEDSMAETLNYNPSALSLFSLEGSSLHEKFPESFITRIKSDLRQLHFNPPIPSEFEKELSATLQRLGYEVQEQPVYFGFHFDLGISIPTSEGNPLICVVEADGPKHFLPTERGLRRVGKDIFQDSLSEKYHLGLLRVTYSEWDALAPGSERERWLMSKMFALAQRLENRRILST